MLGSALLAVTAGIQTPRGRVVGNAICVASAVSARAIAALGRVPPPTKLPPAPAVTDPGAWPAPLEVPA